MQWSMGLHRIGHDWATEQQWPYPIIFCSGFKIWPPKIIFDNLPSRSGV